MALLPVVALVGRPNVGKSTLFNRLTRSRSALVADIPGLTRDRQYGRARAGEQAFVVVDSGGFEPVVRDGITAEMARQTRRAVLEADVVLFIVDGRAGLTPQDLDIAAELRRTARSVLVVVNKTEGMPRAQVAAEFHELGLGDPLSVSAAHGDGVRDLIELALEPFAPPPVADDEDETGDEGEGASGEDDEGAAVVAAQASAVDAGDAGNAGAANEDSADAGSTDLAANATADAIADPAATAASDAQAESPRVRVAVIGRPNVGKSTLINTLIGEERLIAFDQPGTTRDAVEVEFDRGPRRYTLVDTAGLRRRGKVGETIEKFSAIKTLQAIEDCNVCVLLLDATEPVAEQDATIAGYVLEAGRALVVAVNKWDAIGSEERERFRRELDRKLHFLSFARHLFVSALKGSGVGALLRSVDGAYAAATARLSTPRLTRALQDAVAKQPPPRGGRFRPKMRYAHQGGRNPPVVVIHGSGLSDVGEPYRRYLEGWFRQAFELSGTPLRVEFRSAANPYADR